MSAECGRGVEDGADDRVGAVAGEAVGAGAQGGEGAGEGDPAGGRGVHGEPGFGGQRAARRRLERGVAGEPAGGDAAAPAAMAAVTAAAVAVTVRTGSSVPADPPRPVGAAGVTGPTLAGAPRPALPGRRAGRPARGLSSALPVPPQPLPRLRQLVR